MNKLRITCYSNLILVFEDFLIVKNKFNLSHFNYETFII